MTETSRTSNQTWRFPKAFWIANAVELLERAAWYGVFVAITLYLSRILAFTDIEAAMISGTFTAGLYFLPTFSGAYADKMGFRGALLLAFGLLTIGYTCMWLLPTMIQSAGLASYSREVEFTGLQNSYTYHLRTFRPSHVFIMSENDYNPDHKMVFQELLISLFHAQGAIWPELGPPLGNVPHVYEMAAYCNFKADPTVELAADAEEFEKKLDAVDSYQSQRQIKILIENLRKNGPYEYIRDMDFDFYSPGRYRSLFQGDEGRK